MKGLKIMANHVKDLNLRFLFLIFVVIFWYHFGRRKTCEIKKQIISVNLNQKAFDEILPPPKLQMTIMNSSTVQQRISINLYNTVKVLCLINTSKKDLVNRAIHVNATWARRCNKALFLSQAEKINLPILNVNVPDPKPYFYNKIQAVYNWVYKHELNNYGYFLLADDTTYVIMENLRLFLLSYNHNNANHFGCRLKSSSNDTYMSQACGIILSREALRQLVPAFNNPQICPQKSDGFADEKIGTCMKELGIPFVDTRDPQGRHRMLPWEPHRHFRTGLPPSQLLQLYYPYKQSQAYECCADHMISFHNVNKDSMYILEFLIYYSKVIGRMDTAWVEAFRAQKPQT